MRRLALLAVPAVLALAAPAAAQGRDPIEFRTNRNSARQQYEQRVRGEVENTKRQWLQAWESDNAGALSELYTRDAVVVKQTGETVRTQRAIRDDFAKELSAATNLQTQPVDFATSGDLAYEVGTMSYVVEQPGRGAEMRAAIYFTVYERQWDASWKIQSQMLGEPGAQLPRAPQPSQPAQR